MNYNKLKFIKNQVRKISYSLLLYSQKNHYDSLGISKNATQADIKSAYYELSKIYHPDKNKSGLKENEQRFRDITAAYEVLGNVKARRLYDKGFLSHNQSHKETTRDPLHKFYKSRETRNRPPPPGGRVPVYDFDEWTKTHYAEMFERKKEMKERHAFHAHMTEELKARDSERTIVLFLFALVCLPAAIKKIFDYDNPLQQKKLQAEKEYFERNQE